MGGDGAGGVPAVLASTRTAVQSCHFIAMMQLKDRDGVGAEALGSMRSMCCFLTVDAVVHISPQPTHPLLLIVTSMRCPCFADARLGSRCRGRCR